MHLSRRQEGSVGWLVERFLIQVKLSMPKRKEQGMIASLILAVLFSAGAPPGAAASADKPGEGKEKLICQREVPIGSLIATRKVCLTASQWEQRRVDGRNAAYKMMMDGMGKGMLGTSGACTVRGC
jgi:hypothetical protein